MEATMKRLKESFPLWPSRLGLQRGKTPPNKGPGYDPKQSDGVASVMLSFGKCGVPLYCHRSQVHLGPEWKHLVESYGLNRTKQCTYAKLNSLK